MRTAHALAKSAAILAFVLAGAASQQQVDAKDGVERRAVDIWSDGTRMAGDLWLPEGYGQDLFAKNRAGDSPDAWLGRRARPSERHLRAEIRDCWLRGADV